MSKFEFEEEAESVLSKHNQTTDFKQRFVGFCQNAMEGTAEEGDLERLIENVTLPEGESIDES
jgi:hypothetical protein